MKITREAKAGFVVIVTMIAFYTLFNFLKGKNLFSSGNTYYVVYSDVSGLAPSKPVTVNGLRVGRVDNIEIVDDARPIYFVATIKLERKIDFSKNTIAQIWEPGLMSGAEVRLLLDYKGNSAKSGDTLRGELKHSMLDEFSTKLEPTQKKLDSLMMNLNTTIGDAHKLVDDENRENFKQVLKNLDATLVSFNQTSKSLTQTSDSAGKLIEENREQLTKTLSVAQTTVEKFGQTADKLNNLELEKIIANFEQVSAKLNQTLDEINSGKGTMGALLKDRELYDNLLKTTNSLDELLSDMKKHPDRYIQFSIFGKKQQPLPKEE
ncbi:MAG: MCE family protein [Flavobacteriia bacterium]|nr:MCE family protein [Flavobacteriia bacterium]